MMPICIPFHSVPASLCMLSRFMLCIRQTEVARLCMHSLTSLFELNVFVVTEGTYQILKWWLIHIQQDILHMNEATTISVIGLHSSTLVSQHCSEYQIISHFLCLLLRQRSNFDSILLDNNTNGIIIHACSHPYQIFAAAMKSISKDRGKSLTAQSPIVNL